MSYTNRSQSSKAMDWCKSASIPHPCEGWAIIWQAFKATLWTKVCEIFFALSRRSSKMSYWSMSKQRTKTIKQTDFGAFMSPVNTVLLKTGTDRMYKTVPTWFGWMISFVTNGGMSYKGLDWFTCTPRKRKWLGRPEGVKDNICRRWLNHVMVPITQIVLMTARPLVLSQKVSHIMEHEHLAKC